jgi:DNA-directed RNA polymerase specialized sigma24 family protein
MGNDGTPPRDEDRSRAGERDPLWSDELHATLSRLEASARAFLAKRGIPPRPDLQPASVVHSVVARALDRRPDANDCEHLLAILHTAVEQKIIDRLRRGGRGGRERTEADLGAPVDGAAPATPRSATADDEQGAVRLRAILSRAAPSADTARLVELHLFQGLSLGEAAKSLGISRDAAKDRYHSARSRVLDALLVPLRRTLSPDDTRIADAIFSERLDVAGAAAALGLGESSVRERMTEAVIPAILAAYGSHGAAAMTTLAFSRR